MSTNIDRYDGAFIPDSKALFKLAAALTSIGIRYVICGDLEAARQVSQYGGQVLAFNESSTIVVWKG